MSSLAYHGAHVKHAPVGRPLALRQAIEYRIQGSRRAGGRVAGPAAPGLPRTWATLLARRWQRLSGGPIRAQKGERRALGDLVVCPRRSIGVTWGLRERSGRPTLCRPRARVDGAWPPAGADQKVSTNQRAAPPNKVPQWACGVRPPQKKKKK